MGAIDRKVALVIIIFVLQDYNKLVSNNLILMIKNIIK